MAKSDPFIFFAITVSVAASFKFILDSGNSQLLTLYSVILAGSALAFFITVKMIPNFKGYNLKADMFGMDINKKGTPGGQVRM